ncbi:MAG: TIGR03905 family TSCPD domain-containing protein [Clostridia bacterium]|nr:TIGR03905 family TSCPD domain-containing protein [Clostridia bacterium]
MGRCEKALYQAIFGHKTRTLILIATVSKLAFLYGGCEGNHRGLAALAEGMTPDEAVKRLRGITCGTKKSSCPDQLAVALEEFVKNQK